MQIWLTWFEKSGLYSPLFESFMVLCIALLIERILPWPEKYHPLSLFRLVCINLATKVNPAKKARVPSQSKLAGTLATVILLFPTLTIIGILISFAYYPQFFEILLLLIAIQIQPIRRHFRLTKKGLGDDKKSLSRHHLNLIVLRDTQRLSPLGIAKAAIESLLLRYHYQVFGIIFWFMLTGGLGALAVRLLYEMAQCWNTKLDRNQNYGKFCSFLVTLLYLPSTVIFCVFFMLAQGIIRGLRGLADLRSKGVSLWSNGIFIKAICGGSLGIQLGGPAYYAGVKRRYAKLGGTREIVYADLQRLSQALVRVLAITLVGLFLSIVLIQNVWANSNDEIKRIVSLAPHTTELVFALGKEHQLVAVSDYSDYPIAAKELPSVADYNGVDFEAIVRLKPDLILAWKGGNKPQDLARLARLGYRMFYSSPKTVWEIADEIVELGNILDVNKRAIDLSERYLTSLTELESKYHTQKPLGVFYYMWPKPLMSIGKNAWANHLLEICGAKNIFQDSLSDYPEVTLEEVLRRKPTRIIAAMKIARQEAQSWWEGYQEFHLTNVVVVNPDRLHRFTPRILEGLDDLCSQLN